MKFKKVTNEDKKVEKHTDRQRMDDQTHSKKKK